MARRMIISMIAGRLAVRSTHKGGDDQAHRCYTDGAQDYSRTSAQNSMSKYVRSGANARNVWVIPTQGRPDAHFATFPDELPRRCILAGTSEQGVCAECGAPWEREVQSDIAA